MKNLYSAFPTFRLSALVIWLFSFSTIAFAADSALISSPGTLQPQAILCNSGGTVSLGSSSSRSLSCYISRNNDGSYYITLSGSCTSTTVMTGISSSTSSYNCNPHDCNCDYWGSCDTCYDTCYSPSCTISCKPLSTPGCSWNNSI